ncbi:MAG: zinc metallopeptidase [Oscillospiraceae bacterium]|jgi:Zn-dependent membrane protease YugP|nr:zinc metallopeptidase [Oscillospiraceae bacterium]
MPYYFPFDMYYLILVLPAVLLALFAQIRVQRSFRKYAQVRTRRALTGAQAAQAILQANDLTHIRIEPVAGRLSDHYDPKAGVIRLSEAVYGADSVAAVGVAAHEAGHAVQYGNGYGPIRLRQAIIPVSRVGSMLAMPLVLLGLFLSYGWLIQLGILFFGLAVVFQLVTLPVEFNASRRALAALEERRLLDETELPQARRVLSAAALTYVAALAVSLAQFLRLLLLFGGQRGRRR